MFGRQDRLLLAAREVSWQPLWRPFFQCTLTSSRRLGNNFMPSSCICSDTYTVFVGSSNTTLLAKQFPASLKHERYRISQKKCPPKSVGYDVSCLVSAINISVVQGQAAWQNSLNCLHLVLVNRLMSRLWFSVTFCFRYWTPPASLLPSLSPQSATWNARMLNVPCLTVRLLSPWGGWPPTIV